MALNKVEEVALKEAAAVKDMMETEGFKIFKQYLNDSRNLSYPDPMQFKSEEEFTYAAKYASTLKKVLGEVIGWFDEKDNTFKTLKQKQNNPPMRIGA